MLDGGVDALDPSFADADRNPPAVSVGEAYHHVG
jgi:hypothetical protein